MSLGGGESKKNAIVIAALGQGQSGECLAEFIGVSVSRGSGRAGSKVGASGRSDRGSPG